MTKKPHTADVTADKASKSKGDVVQTSFDNEHKTGVVCTLTFEDGSTSVGTAPSTGALAEDQEAALAMASMA